MIFVDETTNQQEFEALLGLENYPVTQTFAYGEWHRVLGRKVIRCVVERAGAPVAVFQVIRFPLGGRIGFLSIPHGPVLGPAADDEKSRVEIAAAIEKKLLELAERERAAFIRFDPVPPDFGKYFSDTRPAPAVAYRSVYAQPRHEWVLGLKNKTPDELLAAMHPKMRYNMGLAERRGVNTQIVAENLSSQLDEIILLMTQTAGRDGFSLHPRGYYAATLDLGGQLKNAFVAVARYDDQVLAANYVLTFGKTAGFVYGGSSNEHRNLMAGALLQKAIIEELLRRGIERYNLGGVTPDAPEGEQGESDTWSGFSTFKRRLGGKMISYGESRDIILKPFWYWAWVAQKAIRSLLK